LVEPQGLKSLRENSRIWEVREAHSRSLHCAPPDFLWTLVALVHFMRPSLRKGAHAAFSSAAWQEIRVRSGRDDNSSWKLYLAFPHKLAIPTALEMGQASLQRGNHRLGTVGHVQAHQDHAYMGLDSGLFDGELVGDFPVALAAD
jgi:hypothetical protein